MPTREHKANWWKQLDAITFGEILVIVAVIAFVVVTFWLWYHFDDVPRHKEAKIPSEVAPGSIISDQSEAKPPKLTKEELAQIKPVKDHRLKISGITPINDLGIKQDMSRRELFYRAIEAKERRGLDNPYDIKEAYWQDACETSMRYDPVTGYAAGWEYKSENYNDPEKAKNIIDNYAMRWEPKAYLDNDWNTLAKLHRRGCNWKKVTGMKKFSMDRYAEEVCNLIREYEKENGK